MINRQKIYVSAIITTFLFCFFCHDVKGIQVIYPNGGEVWNEGGNYTIRWADQKVNNNVRIILKGNTVGELIIANSAPNNGSYQYKVPIGLGRDKYKIRVMTLDESAKDESNESFSIAKLKPSLRNSPFNTELRYIQRVGFVDGTNCEVWPKRIELSPASLTSSLTEARDAIGAKFAGYDYLYEVLGLMYWMELGNPIVIGSKHELTLTYANLNSEEDSNTAGDDRLLVVVDEITGVGYALSRKLLCSPEDIEEDNCQVLNANERKEAIVSIADGRTDIKILKRIEPRSDGVAQSHEELDSSFVLLVAPVIKISDIPIESDVNLVLVADTIAGHRTLIEFKTATKIATKQTLKRESVIMKPTLRKSPKTNVNVDSTSETQAASITVRSPVFKEIFEGRPETKRTIPTDWPKWRQDLAYVVAPGVLVLAVRRINGIQSINVLPDTSDYNRYSKVVFQPDSYPGIRIDNAGRILYVNPYTELVKWSEPIVRVLDTYMRPPQEPSQCTAAKWEVRQLRLDLWLPRISEAIRGGVVTISCGGDANCEKIRRQTSGLEKTQVLFEGGIENFADKLIQMIEERLEAGSGGWETWPCESVNWSEHADENGDGIPDHTNYYDCVCYGYDSLEVRIRDSDSFTSGSVDEKITILHGEYGALAPLKRSLKNILSDWLSQAQTRGTSGTRPIAALYNGYNRLHNDIHGNSIHQAVLSDGEIINQMYYQADQLSLRSGEIKEWDVPHRFIRELPGYQPKPPAGTCAGIPEDPEECRLWETFLDYNAQLFGVDRSMFAKIDQRARYLSDLEGDTGGERSIFVNAINRQYGYISRGWYQERDHERIYGTTRDKSPPSFASYQEDWENAREWVDRVQSAISDLEEFSGNATQDAVERLIDLTKQSAEELAKASDNNLLSKERAMSLLKSTAREMFLLRMNLIETLELAWNCGYIEAEGCFSCYINHRPNPGRDSIADEFAPCEDKWRETLGKMDDAGSGIKTVGEGLKWISKHTSGELVKFFGKVGSTMTDIGKGISILVDIMENSDFMQEPCAEVSDYDRELLKAQLLIAGQLLKSINISLNMSLIMLESIRGDVDYYQSSSESLWESMKELEDLKRDYDNTIREGIENRRKKALLLCSTALKALKAAQSDLYTVNQILQTTRGYPFLTPYFEIPSSILDKPNGELDFDQAKCYGFGISLWDTNLEDCYFSIPEDLRMYMLRKNSGIILPSSMERRPDQQIIPKQLYTRSLSRNDSLSHDLFKRIGEVGVEYFGNYRTLEDSIFIVRKRLLRSSCHQEGHFLECRRPEPDSYCDGVDAFLANGTVRFEVGIDDLLASTASDITKALEMYEYVFRTPPIIHKVYYQVYHAGCRYDELSGKQNCDVPEQNDGVCRIPGTNFVYNCDWGNPHRFADMGFWRVEGARQTSKLYLINAASLTPSLEEGVNESGAWQLTERTDYLDRRIRTRLQSAMTRPQIELIDVVNASTGNTETLGKYVGVSEKILFNNQFLGASSIHGLPLFGTWYLVFKRDTAEKLADQLFLSSQTGEQYWPPDHCEFTSDAPYEHDDFMREENGLKPFDLDTISAIDLVFIVGWLPTNRVHYVPEE